MNEVVIHEHEAHRHGVYAHQHRHAHDDDLTVRAHDHHPHSRFHHPKVSDVVGYQVNEKAAARMGFEVAQFGPTTEEASHHG